MDDMLTARPIDECDRICPVSHRSAPDMGPAFSTGRRERNGLFFNQRFPPDDKSAKGALSGHGVVGGVNFYWRRPFPRFADAGHWVPTTGAIRQVRISDIGLSWKGRVSDMGPCQSSAMVLKNSPRTAGSMRSCHDPSPFSHFLNIAQLQ